MRGIIYGICCLWVCFAFAEEAEEIILSTPDQVASASTDHLLVGGLISPLSGHPVLRQTDLVVRGAQELVLGRVYISPPMPCHFSKPKHHHGDWDQQQLVEYLIQNYKGWKYLPHLYVQRTGFEVRVTDPNGTTLAFHVAGGETLLATSAFGMSNTAREVPSGAYDPRNTRMVCNGHEITIYAPDGTIRFYRFSRNRYHLEKEILPSGKIIRYRHKNHNLNRIESWDPQERYLYASIDVQWSCFDELHFTSSSGVSVDYTYRMLLSKGETRHKHKKKEFTRSFPAILESVSSPFYKHEKMGYCPRFLLVDYAGKEEVFKCLHNDVQGFYRVQKLSLPVGAADSFHPLYELSYQPPVPGKQGGTTTAKNSDGTKVVYQFSKDLLPISIKYLGKNGVLKREKKIVWKENQWLDSVEIRDGYKHLLHRKSYEYDRFGNPVLEVFSGDLAGEGHLETFTTKRTFSEEGRHLLLREETEDGKVICLSYLPNSNLVTSKLTKDGDKIVLREFSVYDDCNNLVQKISDDGDSEDKDDVSAVTQRTLTTYILRQEAPFLHMPEWVVETYWEAGMNKPLKKSHLIYDQYGNVAFEEVYDAEGKLRYTLCKTYNECGDLLTETNRLGQEAVYTYDSRGRPETSTNFSHRLHKTFHHDTQGRLRKLTEKGEDGEHVTSAEYDENDRLLEKTDLFQNATRYTYDPLVNRIARTDFPSIASEEGQEVSVSTLSTYDSFGREITKTDARGFTTTTCYNAYGSPTAITYPDGNTEQFRYAKNGTLASHTDLDGHSIHYVRDVLGRVLSKTYISKKGQFLAEETFTYNGFQLLTETDKEGHVREHFYDGAGRKIREEYCGKAVEFVYDSLGWLATVCAYNKDNTLLTHYKRDLEGQILEEWKTDTSNHLLYKITHSYNADGDQESTTRFIQGQKAVDTFLYDCFRRLTEHRDALGYVTTTAYDETHRNALGQTVLRRMVTDPQGITTITTQDALAHIVKKETLNPKHALIACQEKIYDPQGNLAVQKDDVYEKDLYLKTQTLKFTYTTNNQIESFTRGFGTKEERTTSFTYTPSGKIETKTLPDGITLTHTYHPLGFLSVLTSSDGKIDHTFEHDKLGYLRRACDENEQITILRDVDPFGNVIRELLPHAIEKTYDLAGRPLSLKIGDEQEILYTYDPLFLRSVTRVLEREILYAHDYEHYDQNGDLVSENLVGNLGQVLHTTDLRRQKASISSPYFSQECAYDAAGNLLTNTEDGAVRGYSYDDLSQLTSETPSFIYAYDSLYNRTEKNGYNLKVNNLNELLSQSSYDLRGNQTFKHPYRLTYDPLNRLVEALSKTTKIHFVYDPLGRRLSKEIYTATDTGWQKTLHENYLYDGHQEIGACTPDGTLKNLKVLGKTHTPIAIELEGQFFAPILDVQGNIRRLIDPTSKTLASSCDFTAFGEDLRNSLQDIFFSPWRFASKRFDPELGLIYFGTRYYDPTSARWITTDPAGFIDSTNLYQYVFNNPFRYYDPNGESAASITLNVLQIAFGAAAAAISSPLWVPATIALVAVEACLLVGYHLYEHHAARMDASSWPEGYSTAYDYGSAARRREHMAKKEVRTEPEDLEEQLALEEAKAGSGKEIPPDKLVIKDPKYPTTDWAKVQHEHTKADGSKVNIHYWENRHSGERHGFKFKNEK